MKIYDQDKTEIIENPDLEKGYLIPDRLLINVIPAKPEVKEEFHYEYVHYPSGGRDAIKVIDVPYQAAEDEKEEYEDIEIYIPHTKEFLEKRTLNQELNTINIWFEWYDNQVKQYERAIRRGEEFDKDIVQLDEDADLKQKRIREINQRLEEIKKEEQQDATN